MRFHQACISIINHGYLHECYVEFRHNEGRTVTSLEEQNKKKIKKKSNC